MPSDYFVEVRGMVVAMAPEAELKAEGFVAVGMEVWCPPVRTVMHGRRVTLQ